MAGVRGLCGRKPTRQISVDTLRQMVRQAGPEAFRRILSMMRSPLVPDYIRLEAAKFIVEHNIGKPRQAVDIDAQVLSTFLIHFEEQFQLNPGNDDVKVIEGEKIDELCSPKCAVENQP